VLHPTLFLRIFFVVYVGPARSLRRLSLPQAKNTSR